MQKKINVTLLFGGQSVEHEVSVSSARNVDKGLDRHAYQVTLMGIDKEGRWGVIEGWEAIDSTVKIEGTFIDPWHELSKADVVFPILHGQMGEDGTVQGMLQLLGVPFVGAGVLGSAIGMDKEVMKKLLRAEGIAVAPFVAIASHEAHLWSAQRIVESLSFPLFVKPANGGSSVGVTKVVGAKGFIGALEKALLYDKKALVEEAIEGMELQCGVLGNEDPIASLPCAIFPKGELHSYESKYLDPEGAEWQIPAEMGDEVIAAVQELSLKVYRALYCEGMARVDLFLKPSGELVVNELNTLPGVTSTSPFCKMWESSGLSWAETIDYLITLAINRHREGLRIIRQIEVQQKWAHR